MNLLHLLAQNVIALRFAQFFLRLITDLAADVEDFDLVRQIRMHQPQQFALGIGFEQCLLLFDAQIEHGAEKVSQPHGIVRLHDDVANLWRHVRQQRQRLLNQRLNVALQGLDFRRLLAYGFRQNLDARFEVWRLFCKADYTKALLPLNDQVQHIFLTGRPHHAIDDDERADLIKTAGRRLGILIAALGDDAEQFFFCSERCFRRLQRQGPPDRQRRDARRKHDRAAQRQYRQLEGLRFLFSSDVL